MSWYNQDMQTQAQAQQVTSTGRVYSEERVYYIDS
jgi:hypothetical protein